MSIRSLLVNYNSSPSSLDSLMPDNGLINIASSLLSDGHYVKILDFSTLSFVKELITEDIHQQLGVAYSELSKGKGHVFKILPKFQALNIELENRKQHLIKENVTGQVIREIEQIEPHFIGFKLWTGEGFVGSVEIAKAIKKKFPKITLIGGGPHNDWFHEHTYEYTDIFDVLVYGEGEETIIELAKWLEGNKKLEDINNIIYQKNGKVIKNPLCWIRDMDSLPDPVFDFSIYPALEGNEKIKVMMIDESRGCPNSCNFCIHPKKSGNKWRTRSASKVIKIIKNAQERLGTNSFRLAGSNPPPQIMEDIADLILKENLEINYISFGHTKSWDGQFEKLKEAGCLSLFFGIESGNDGLLKNIINKKVDAGRMKEALLACKQADIDPIVSVIMPSPGETFDSFKDTLNLLTSVKPAGVSVYLPGVIPGAEWFENRDKYEIELTETDYSALMTYTIKFLMPPLLWQPMPYTIGKKTFTQMMLAADLLSSNLERNGILTGLNETMLLFGNKLNIAASDIRNLNRKMFITGDCKTLEQTVTKFNQSVGAVNSA